MSRSTVKVRILHERSVLSFFIAIATILLAGLGVVEMIYFNGFTLNKNLIWVITVLVVPLLILPTMFFLRLNLRLLTIPIAIFPCVELLLSFIGGFILLGTLAFACFSNFLIATFFVDEPFPSKISRWDIWHYTKRKHLSKKSP